MKFAQIVMGPAGTGKTTYCANIREHCINTGRNVKIINLDPAAEDIKYPISADIRELISVEDAMDELEYGPNGGLIFCMEYMMEHMEWLTDELEAFGEDDYVLFDCPGQIELYSHVPVMRSVVSCLQNNGFNVCGVYLVDALYCSDAAKFISGSLSALAAMTHLEIPHVNVMTKCDKVDKKVYERFLVPDGEALTEMLRERMPPKFHSLNASIASVLDDFSLVRFLPLDVRAESSFDYVLGHIDMAIQYGEDMEPKEPRDTDFDEDTEAMAARMAEVSAAVGGEGV